MDFQVDSERTGQASPTRWHRLTRLLCRSGTHHQQPRAVIERGKDGTSSAPVNYSRVATDVWCNKSTTRSSVFGCLFLQYCTTAVASTDTPRQDIPPLICIRLHFSLTQLEAFCKRWGSSNQYCPGHTAGVVLVSFVTVMERNG